MMEVHWRELDDVPQEQKINSYYLQILAHAFGLRFGNGENALVVNYKEEHYRFDFISISCGGSKYTLCLRAAYLVKGSSDLTVISNVVNWCFYNKIQYLLLCGRDKTFYNAVKLYCNAEELPVQNGIRSGVIDTFSAVSNTRNIVSSIERSLYDAALSKGISLSKMVESLTIYNLMNDIDISWGEDENFFRLNISFQPIRNGGYVLWIKNIIFPARYRGKGIFRMLMNNLRRVLPGYNVDKVGFKNVVTPYFYDMLINQYYGGYKTVKKEYGEGFTSYETDVVIDLDDSW